jgi:hypothetical protein
VLGAIALIALPAIVTLVRRSELTETVTGSTTPDPELGIRDARPALAATN